MRCTRRYGWLSVVLIYVAAAWAPAASAASPLKPYVVMLRPGATASAVAPAGAQLLFRYRYAVHGYAALLPAALVRALRANPAVASVRPDTPFHLDAEDEGGTSIRLTGPQQVPPTPRRIGVLLGAKRRAAFGAGAPVNVAVIDTGVMADHPDLDVRGGADCVRTIAGPLIGALENAAGQLGIDLPLKAPLNPFPSAPGPDFSDAYGHGTHVAGIIGALDNGLGIVGSDPNARIWGLKVFDGTDDAALSSVVCALDWVARTRKDSNPDNDISVVNISLGQDGSDDSDCGRKEGDIVHAAICGVTAAGVVPVVSAGNDGVDFKGTIPATYSEVLTATAITDSDGAPGGKGGAPSCPDGDGERDDAAATFSNYATLPSDAAHTVAAPGVCILSTFNDGNYYVESGTSSSAPAVAGVVAQCVATGPCRGLTPAQTIARIVADSRRYNVAHPRYGFDGDPRHEHDGRYFGDLVYAGTACAAPGHAGRHRTKSRTRRVTSRAVSRRAGAARSSRCSRSARRAP
jgi:subtilisin family serine protease